MKRKMGMELRNIKMEMSIKDISKKEERYQKHLWQR